MSYLKDKRVVVTGGNGFLGSYLIKKLESQGCSEILIPRSSEYNLIDRDGIIAMYEDMKPDVVIHLAAVVGGIGANMENPGKFFYDNLMMGTQLMEYGRQYKIDKFVAIGTICAYPKFTPVPFKEDDIWIGYPEETNAPYGLAKKMMLVQSQAYRDQYDYNSIFLLPVNLYGPRDNFDPASSHVIPALIRKFEEARINNDPEVSVWGDGSASREFIYADDAAEGILRATELFNDSEPVNIGSGMEITIKDLVTKIKEISGYEGKVVYDTSKPNGQPRRCLDTSRAEKLFGFKSYTEFDEGLKNTIEWFRDNME